MKKMSFMFSSIILASILVTGCGTEDVAKTFNIDTTTTSDGSFSVSRLAGDSIDISWSKYPNPTYGSYAQLEVMNSEGNFIIATTNSSSQINIHCTLKDTPSSYKYYICKADNVSYTRSIKITDSNNFIQRGGVNDNSPTNAIGSF